MNQKLYEDFLSDENLDIMCRDNLVCMCVESTKICNDYIKTGNVTEALLKVYVDCHDSDIVFIYEDKNNW